MRTGANLCVGLLLVTACVERDAPTSPVSARVEAALNAPRDLVSALRNSSYFGVSPTDATDLQLKSFVDSHKQGVEALLAQVDYGRAVQTFKETANLCNLKDPYKSFMRDAQKADALETLQHLADLENALFGGTLAYEILSQALDAINTILFGFKVFELFKCAATSGDVHAVLVAYFEGRTTEGLTPHQTWNEKISSTFAPLLGKVWQALFFPQKYDPADPANAARLEAWFENAFEAYRLAQSPDARFEIGRVIAGLAARGAAPTVETGASHALPVHARPTDAQRATDRRQLPARHRLDTP